MLERSHAVFEKYSHAYNSRRRRPPQTKLEESGWPASQILLGPPWRLSFALGPVANQIDRGIWQKFDRAVLSSVPLAGSGRPFTGIGRAFRATRWLRLTCSRNFPDGNSELVGPPTRGQGVGQSLCVEGSAVLDAVQDAIWHRRSRREASWTASVRDALPIGRSGRRNGRWRSNKGMKFTSSR
jgi:hypothetical protein